MANRSYSTMIRYVELTPCHSLFATGQHRLNGQLFFVQHFYKWLVSPYRGPFLIETQIKGQKLQQYFFVYYHYKCLSPPYHVIFTTEQHRSQGQKLKKYCFLFTTTINVQCQPITVRLLLENIDYMVESSINTVFGLASP